MHRTSHRSASVCPVVVVVGVVVVGALLSISVGGVAHADDSANALTGRMQCERAAEPGRVKCSVEAQVTGGRSIAWADVALLELPEFTAALKGRIGPSDATSRDATSQKWAFGLVARKTGDGEAKARVRALVCEPQSSDAGPLKCAPITVDVKAIVHVG